MANNPTDSSENDFLEQILGMQTFDPNTGAPMLLQLNSGGDPSSHLGAGLYHHQAPPPAFPLGLSLEHGTGGFMKPEESIRGAPPRNVFHGQPMPNTVPTGPQPPPVRPRVRARRGQATDPHSIAERLRRERIAERIRALQELVPSVNKTDRAAMLDEIVDYVKFLRLQVKVLSMSRLGGAGAVAPLVTDIPLSSIEEDGSEGGGGGARNQPAWEQWSNDGTEKQVAKLMEENVGAAMQFLQSKQLCIMPISLASAIYHNTQHQQQQSETGSATSTIIKPETNPPS